MSKKKIGIISIIKKVRKYGQKAVKFMDMSEFGLMSPGELPGSYSLFIPTKEVPKVTKKEVITVVAVGAGITTLFAVTTPAAIITTAPLASAWISTNYTAVQTALNDTFLTVSLESMIMAKKIANTAREVLAKERREIAEIMAQIKRLEGR